MAEYHKYAYKGPVAVFDTLVAENWEGETLATSESKARSNLTFQFKRDNCRLVGTKVTLLGKITLVEQGVGNYE